MHWRGDSKLEYVEDGLRDLVKQVKRLGIKSISLPPLGCGNGGLDCWDDVRGVDSYGVQRSSRNRCSSVRAGGAPPAREMVIKTKKPGLTGVRAAIIKVISIYREMEYGLSRIELQKAGLLSGESRSACQPRFSQAQLRPILEQTDRSCGESIGRSLHHWSRRPFR